MSHLDSIGLRLKRDGRWQSLLLADVDYLTDDEVAALSWADLLRDMLDRDPAWQRVGTGWMRERRS